MTEAAPSVATLHVPLIWLITAIVTLGSSIIMAIGWWIIRELRRNDDEHVMFDNNMRLGHEKLEQKIDVLNRKVDHMILHLASVPPIRDS